MFQKTHHFYLKNTQNSLILRRISFKPLLKALYSCSPQIKAFLKNIRLLKVQKP